MGHLLFYLCAEQWLLVELELLLFQEQHLGWASLLLEVGNLSSQYGKDKPRLKKILCFETWAFRYLKMWTGILGAFLMCRYLYLPLTSNSVFEQAALPVIMHGQVPLNLSEPFSVWNNIWVKMRNLASHLGLADAWSPGGAPAALPHVQRSWVDGLLPFSIPDAFSIYNIPWPSL